MFGHDQNLVCLTRVLTKHALGAELLTPLAGGAVQNITLPPVRRVDGYQDRRSNAPSLIRLSREGLVTVYPIAITNLSQLEIISNYFDLLLALICIHLRLMSTVKQYV